MKSDRHRGEAEQGAAAMALVVVVSILLLGFAMLVGVRLATATDEASGLQGAADAAALAGAQSIVTDAPGQIVSALVNGQSIPGGLGQEDARDFASRNDATLVYYNYNPLQDRVRVTVRSKDVLESGQREERSAAAEVGMPFGPCEQLQVPAPPSTSTSSTTSPSSSPSTSTSPSTPPPPPPVDDVPETLECGGLDLPVVWKWSEEDGWGPDFQNVNADLIKALDLEPALAE